MADVKFKGKTLITPKGKALWCKVTTPDRKFNTKGEFATDLVLDPSDANVAKFLGDLQAMLDEASEQQRGELKAPKNKTLKVRELTKPQYDEEGEETGLVIMSFKMKDVDDREVGDNKIVVFDSNAKEIKNIPLVGNDSIVKIQAYFKPYYMPSDNSMGISKYWKGLQIIKLNEYSGASGFGKEDGDYEVDEDDTSSFSAEEDSNDDF